MEGQERVREEQREELPEEGGADDKASVADPEDRRAAVGRGESGAGVRGQVEPRERDRDRSDEAGERAGRADVEEGLLVRERLPDADERAERPEEERRRERDEVGKRGVDLAPPGHEVVRELVEPEDGEDRDGEVQRPVQEVGRGEALPADVGEPDERPRERGGHDGRREEGDVDPVPPAALARPRHDFEEVLALLTSKDRDVPGRPQVTAELVELPFQ